MASMSVEEVMRRLLVMSAILVGMVFPAIVYDNDRQIRQAEFAHVKIDAPLSVAGSAKLLVNSVQKGNPFVYVRIEDPVEPYPLPQ